MFSLVRVFLKVTLKTSIKVLLCVHSAEYQNDLIARDYKPGKVNKQFSDIKKLTREEARRKQDENLN